MAIKNPETNEYLKIQSMQFDFEAGNYHISYNIFRDQSQRLVWGENALSEYEIYKHGMYNGIGSMDENLRKTTDKTTTYEALMDACYQSLKDDTFKGWEDC